MLPDRRPLDDDFEPDFGAYPAGRGLPTDAAVDGSLDPFDDPADDPHGGEPDGPEPEADGPAPVTDPPEDAPGARDGRGDVAVGESGPSSEAAEAGVSPAGRGRRGRGRVPQPV